MKDPGGLQNPGAVCVPRFISNEECRHGAQATPPIMHTHAHACMHTHVRAHTHNHAHAHPHPCARTPMHMHAHVHAHVHTHAHPHTHTHAHAHTRIPMRTHTHPHTQTPEAGGVWPCAGIRAAGNQPRADSTAGSPAQTETSTWPAGSRTQSPRATCAYQPSL